MNQKALKTFLSIIAGYLVADAIVSLTDLISSFQETSDPVALTIAGVITLIYVYGGYLGAQLLRHKDVVSQVRTYLGIMAVIVAISFLAFTLTGAGIEPLTVARQVLIIGGWLLARTEAAAHAIQSGRTNTIAALGVAALYLALALLA